MASHNVFHLRGSFKSPHYAVLCYNGGLSIPYRKKKKVCMWEDMIILYLLGLALEVVELIVVGLGAVGLEAVGLEAVGLGAVELGGNGLGVVGLEAVELQLVPQVHDTVYAMN